MGLLQKAVETYDAHSQLIGKEIEGHQMLVPVSHILTGADLEITLERDGRFSSARLVDKKEPKIPIPATEESAGRTSGDCAHPLCDKLCYLAPYNQKKHRLYVEQLTNWAESAYTHPMLLPILTYIKGGTILADLSDCGLITLNNKGIPTQDGLLVRWRVHGIGTLKDGCWQQQSLFEAFQNWYASCQSGREKNLCMVTGEDTVPAKQHPKGIIPINGNAKLISANDQSGFTFRGRFTEESQAATVGYLASQKAHSALRWLAAEQGASASFGGRVFLCWNPQGRRVCHAAGPFGDPSKVIAKPSDYRQELRSMLMGYRSELPEQDSGVVIAAFDAATTGRLSLTYYSELMGSDYLKRLHHWDNHCCWFFGRDHKIQSPPLWKIISCAYGTQIGQGRDAKFKTDGKVMAQQMQALISCRVDGSPLPFSLIKALVNRASSPQAYEVSVWESILSTACAVMQKYRYDRYQEECNMELNPEKADRSYQYGRLLAVLEKAERDTYSNGETREPNAIRMQSIFSRRPLYAAKIMEDQLERAYFPRLSPGSRSYYKKLIGEIMEQIYAYPKSQWNAPLGETYLMGYYLQRNELYKCKKNPKSEEEPSDERFAEQD